MWPRWTPSNFFCMATFSVWLNTASLTTRAISLIADALHHVEFHQYSVKWSCLPGRECISYLSEQAQPLLYPIPPSPLLTHKARVIQLRHDQYMRTRRTSTAWRSTIPPDGPNPPPFIRGALSHKRRDIFCTCVNFPPVTASTPVILNAFDKVPTTMSHALAAAHTPLTMSSHCRLHNSPRRRIFGQHANLDYIFGTEDGGKKLGDFLLATNNLRLPLPPRPDP